MANNLTREKQVAVVRALTDGCSQRATARMMGVDRETVGTLLTRMGEGCSALLDETMRDLPCTRLELDELWAFTGKKQRHMKPEDDPSKGDTWTYIALDPESKVVPSFLVGKRDQEHTDAFVADLSTRLRGRVQLSTDGLRHYIQAVRDNFGGAVDYAQVVKSYETDVESGRYSPPEVTGIIKTPICGQPDEELASTSLVERFNLSLRTMGRRYTRLTCAFSKKVEQHIASTALLLAAYNFTRVHKTIRMTPAMALGLTEKLWDADDLVAAALDGVRP